MKHLVKATLLLATLGACTAGEGLIAETAPRLAEMSCPELHAGLSTVYAALHEAYGVQRGAGNAAKVLAVGGVLTGGVLAIPAMAISAAKPSTAELRALADNMQGTLLGRLLGGTC